jgi:DNA ligase-1
MPTKLFPSLYKLTATGALQVWEIRTEGNVIVTSWGQVDGARQGARDTIKAGKNVGRTNETTPVEQAQAEAQSQWEKKTKRGYTPTPDKAMAGEVEDVIEGGIVPMLAHRFDEQGHKIKFPAFAQGKLDGHRCIAIVKDGKATLWSRTRKPITSVPHIVAQIEALVSKNCVENIVLDGELYSHNYKDRFEELTSFIRQETPKAGHEVVEYHIYDLANEHPQDHRCFELQNLFRMVGPKFAPALRVVETVAVETEDEMMEAFERFLAQGYEGLMVRNAAGMYVNKRSADLQKVKEFQDSEFEVVGIEEGRGKLAGHAIFVCKTATGEKFNVKLKGETSELKKYFDDPSLAIGRKLTVKYQGITNKTGVPRFPVGERFREDV